MQPKNSISVDGNGNINIQDVTNGNITIHANNEEEMLSELGLLNKIQIDSLLQVIDNQTNQLSDIFKTHLKGIASEKNVTKGSISNVKSIKIGDEKHYHYYTSESKLPKELTLSIPKVHPNDIVGREKDLKELHNLLNNDKRVVVVNGLGGIGKTTLAQVYVSKYYDEYEHIVWITQSSESISTDFINETGLIKNLSVEIAGLEPEQIFEEIVIKLKGIEEKPNLIIIDNGEQSLSKFRDLLPSQPSWHLLITSREEITGFYSKALGFLNEQQAIELFEKYYPLHLLTNEDILELVKIVDYHTLTIELLAKTAKVQRYDAAKLKVAIEEDLRANIEVSHNKEYGKIEKVGSYLSSVFSLSNLTEHEIWLLKQFACLPSDFHPYNLLYELLINEESPYRDIFSETLSGLSQKGWLLQNTATDSYKMHRIIADVVKKEHPIDFADVKNLVSEIDQKLYFDQTKDNPTDNFEWIPFGKALVAKLE